MKFLYLTAGAAGMYCGSCMLDNALARALIRKGHDALLVPLYTPIRTDEEDVSLHRVFYGGINVYLQQRFAWARYLPRWLDGILNQPWLIRPLTANTGQTSPELLGALAVSMLRGTDGYQRKETLRLCDWVADEVRPEAVVLTNLLIGGCIPELRRRTKASIFVTLQGDDIFLDHLNEADRVVSIAAMQRLVSQVDGFIVHSRDYGRRMGELLRIPDDKLHVLPLGIDTREFKSLVAKTVEPDPIVVGYFARLAPEKGLDLLVDGFIELTKRFGKDRLRLRIAGWLGSQHQAYWNEQQRKLEQAGLVGCWQYDGSVERSQKLNFFRSIDLLTVPTRYQEPKGLFVLEAAAAGVPYLQPDHGAFPELHARLKFGQLFRAGDATSFVDELEKAVRALQSARDTASSPRSAATAELLEEVSIDKMAERFLSLPWKNS